MGWSGKGARQEGSKTMERQIAEMAINSACARMDEVDEGENEGDGLVAPSEERAILS